MSAEVRQLLRRVKAHGVSVEPTNSGHWRLRRGQQAITVSATPNGHYWLAKAVADIRRHLGVDLRTQTRPKRRRNRKDST